MNENYKRNVVAYIAMYIRDFIADPNSDNDDLSCYDIVFEIADGLADQFIGSEFDSSSHSLYDCIEEFLERDEMVEFFADYK